MNQIQTTAVTMTSREIAELTGKELSHIHRDIRTMLDELEKDDPNLDHPLEDKDSRGYTTCFHLSRELTMTLISGYDIPLRHRIVTRLAELENRTAVDPMKVLNDPAAMRGLLLGYAEKVLALEADLQKVGEDLQVAAPKAAFHDAVASAVNVQSFEEVAKVCGTGRNRLMRWLRSIGVLQEGNRPQQRFIDQGYFRVLETVYFAKGTSRTSSVTRVTGKGLPWLQDKLSKESGLLS